MFVGMPGRCVGGLLAGTLIVFILASAAPAQEPANPAAGPRAFLSNTEIGGLADVYYDWYSTKRSSSPLYRNFDTKYNEFSFTMVQLWLAKTVTAASRVGFKVKLNFGPAATEIVHASDPGAALIDNLQEMYISYLAPAGRGLQFDAGVFVTPAGAEVIEAKDNWNYSRSVLFTLAIPHYHTGVRATYKAGEKVTLMGGVVNGWNNLVENNGGKTALGSVTVRPIPALTFIENYIGGPEKHGNDSDWRHLLDTVLTYRVSPQLSLMANYDYGRDTSGEIGVRWQGIAGYLTYQPIKWLAVTPRVEYYDDAQGFMTGVTQRLKEATVTVELKSADNLLWRVEYRRDFSNQAVFKNDVNTFERNQQSIAVGMLYSFSTGGQ